MWINEHLKIIKEFIGSRRMDKEIDVVRSVVYGGITNRFDGLYLGQLGYFSDDPSFEIFYATGYLGNIDTSESRRYETCTNERFVYFIPADKVVFKEEPKKLRPFGGIGEFLKVTKIVLGDAIHYKRKNSDQECVVIFDGYTSDRLVLLGGIYYKLTDLFEYFEYYDNDLSMWKPFGIEE